MRVPKPVFRARTNKIIPKQQLGENCGMEQGDGMVRLVGRGCGDFSTDPLERVWEFPHQTFVEDVGISPPLHPVPLGKAEHSNIVKEHSRASELQNSHQ